MTGLENEEHDAYRLLMVDPAQAVALMERTEADGHLPQVTIPRYTRPAEMVTSTILEKWGMQSVVIDWLPSHDGAPVLAVLQIDANDRRCLPSCMGAMPLGVALADTLSASEASVVSQMLAGKQDDRGPFSRFGWIKEAKSWIRESLHDSSLEFTSIRQLNASGTFALLRFEASTGIAYWLKAVGAPNTQEFSTTSYLAAECPEYLPRIVAMRSDWNAWVMEEFGASLHSSDSLSEFETAARRMASLQIRLIGKSKELLQAHFADHRIQRLDSQIDDLIAYLEEAMGRQSSTKAPVLSPARLQEIGTLLHRACAAMEDLDIPDSVMHSDISPGSILGDGTQCVFTDWCEAYVGNPFITLEQLCVHIARKTNDPKTWRECLIGAYRSSWRDVLTERQIEGALRIVPFLSVLSYLYGRGDWLHSSRREEPEFQSYTRSLARHMDRIAKDSGLMEALCQAA